MEDSTDTAGGDGAGTMPSEQARSGSVRIDLDALVLNIYGLSYHPDREAVDRRNLDNEFNPGLGLHHELTDSARGVSFAEVGAYHDSGRNWAKFAGLGYQFKLGERLKIGGAIAAMHSKTYNGGVGFVAMIPPDHLRSGAHQAERDVFSEVRATQQGRRRGHLPEHPTWAMGALNRSETIR
ncbi:MAG: hypothetical protein WDZ63_04760 [Burkholderiales bacterium]